MGRKEGRNKRQEEKSRADGRNEREERKTVKGRSEETQKEE